HSLRRTAFPALRMSRDGVVEGAGAASNTASRASAMTTASSIAWAGGCARYAWDIEMISFAIVRMRSRLSHDRRDCSGWPLPHTVTGVTQRREFCAGEAINARRLARPCASELYYPLRVCRRCAAWRQRLPQNRASARRATCRDAPGLAPERGDG